MPQRSGEPEGLPDTDGLDQDPVTGQAGGEHRLQQLTDDLAATQERLQSLFDTMLQGVVYHDGDGTITAANPAAAEMLGVEPEQLVGLSSEGPDWAAVREDGTPLPGSEHPAMVALRTGETVRDCVMGVPHAVTGERRWLSVTAVPDRFGADGKPQRVHAMFADVTEQRHAAAVLRERDSFLGRLRDANVLGILFVDDANVLDANAAFLEMLGHSQDDLAQGRIRWTEITPPQWAERDAAAMDELRRTGSCRPFEKEYLHADGHPVPVLIGAAVVQTDPPRYVAFVADLTERRRAEEERARLLAVAEEERARTEQAEERLTFLLQAGAVLAATHDRAQVLEQSTRLVVPLLGDFAVVLLPDREGTLEVAAGTHADPSAAGHLQRLHTSYDGGTGEGCTLQAAFRAPEPRLLHPSAAQEARWPEPGTPFAEALTGLDANSAITVPLGTAERRLGLLVLGRTGGRTAFAPGDLAVMEELGRRLSAGLDNVDTFARDHSVAETLQRAVLPDSLPDLPGLDLAVAYLPATEGAEVGGDWYDAFPVEGGRLAVVLGDVVGHNIASASTMGQLRNAIRAYACDDPDPVDVLRRTNQMMLRLLPETLATVCFGVLDLATGRLELANAGHPPPVACTPDGPRYLETPAGTMLGVQDDPDLLPGSHRLQRGEGLLLYSDGLVEDRSHPIDHGLQALVAALADHGATGAAALCSQVQQRLLGDRPRADDVCLLALRLT